MSDKRLKQARAAANRYAPRPKSSLLMYGVVAIVLLALAFWMIDSFYKLDLLRFPVLLTIALIVSFVGGMLIRQMRMRRHLVAFDDEFQRRIKKDSSHH